MPLKGQTLHTPHLSRYIPVSPTGKHNVKHQQSIICRWASPLDPLIISTIHSRKDTKYKYSLLSMHMHITCKAISTVFLFPMLTHDSWGLLERKATEIEYRGIHCVQLV